MPSAVWAWIPVTLIAYVLVRRAQRYGPEFALWLLVLSCIALGFAGAAAFEIRKVSAKEGGRPLAKKMIALAVLGLGIPMVVTGAGAFGLISSSVFFCGQGLLGGVVLFSNAPGLRWARGLVYGLLLRSPPPT